MNKNKIKVFKGLGSFVDSNTVNINNSSKITQLSFKNAVIATGSKPISLPFAKN